VFTHPFENIQGLFVAYTGKGTFFTSVGLPVRPLEYIWYLQSGANFIYPSGYIKSHLLAFNGARPGNQKEIV
jgi:hypothetical protein